MTISERASLTQPMSRLRRDRERFADAFQDLNPLVEALLDEIGSIQDRAEDAARAFQRAMLGSPYERIMLADRLVSMCEEDAAELLVRQVDGLTFDDVIGTLKKLIETLHALKNKAEAAE